MDFVHSLVDLKRARDQWVQKDISERAQVLKTISENLNQKKSSFVKTSARIQKISENFLELNEIHPAIQIFQEVLAQKPEKDQRPKPTGLISILLPEFFSNRILAERLAPALLGGNGIFVYFSKTTSALLDLWKEVLPSELPVRLMAGDSELEQIMAAHPSIQAVSFYGSPERAQKLPLTPNFESWKKWQLSAGFHNSALILNDVDLKSVAQQLAESCFQGMGQLPWNISTIYVTEPQREEFQKNFLDAIEALPNQSVVESTLQRHEKLLSQFKSERGIILFGGEVGKPTVVEDLSHCSELQQAWLAAPIVLISPVKYVHEMVKWSNTSYYGMYAQIFGPSEKIEKFASQLDVSRVGANSWMSTMTSLPQGIKQSFSGISDLDAFGGFFSDLRKFDGSESKS